MRIPEPLFKVINIVIGGILRSPLHPLISSSLLILSYEGRKSGKLYRVPIRYTQHEGVIRAFTSKETGWWHNFENGASAQIQIKGSAQQVQVTATTDEPDNIRAKLTERLTLFPADAPYQKVEMINNKPDPDSLEKALPDCVLIEMAFRDT